MASQSPMFDPHNLIPRLRDLLAGSSVTELENTEAMHVEETVQSLWSGYGRLVRVRLPEEDTKRVGYSTIIVKYVRPPQVNVDASDNTKFGHTRKLRSYEVESSFYSNPYIQSAAQKIGATIPKLLALSATRSEGAEMLMVLADLNRSGFDRRCARGTLSEEDSRGCLQWLARFHAAFLHDTRSADGSSPFVHSNLWERGTYWHLDTRPTELENMVDGPLKDAARALDAALKGARFQTLLHGDAKEANFCFQSISSNDTSSSPTSIRPVAAVDFQYTGGGVGIQDVAYFIERSLHGKGSPPVSSDEFRAFSEKSLGFYFSELRHCVRLRNENSDGRMNDSVVATESHADSSTDDSSHGRNMELSSDNLLPRVDNSIHERHLRCTFTESDVDCIEKEWRTLYPVALADLTRMWAGWKRPGASFSKEYEFPNEAVKRLVDTGIAHVSK